MICPNCGRNFHKDRACPGCGYTYREGDHGPTSRSRRSGAARAQKVLLRALLWTGSILASFVVIVILTYRAYYWIQELMINHRYATGQETPFALEQIVLRDGRPGHAISFYGRDGDLITINELDQSFMVVGGVARVEIPDGNWFSAVPNDIESAEITLIPIRTSEDGARTLLQTIQFEVMAPQAPLRVVNPAQDGMEVFTSRYQISVVVAPGSRILIDGRDYSGFVGQTGLLSTDVPVDPIGDNHVSIVVDLRHHRQTRRDVTIYRKAQQINLELAYNTSLTSSRNISTIGGRIDPGATLTVDTPHVEDSIKIDQAGYFTFSARYDQFGMNRVRFRASMEGKEDSVITVEVKYVPGFTEYTNNAWRMGKQEYADLLKYSTRWIGQVYLCRGTVIDIVQRDPQIFIMDVGVEGEPRLVAIENGSAFGEVTIGGKYAAYSDLVSTFTHENKHIPFLVTRYMEIWEPQ